MTVQSLAAVSLCLFLGASSGEPAEHLSLSFGSPEAGSCRDVPIRSHPSDRPRLELATNLSAWCGKR